MTTRTTKEKIERTALHLFAKQGVAGTSTSQITKKVGVAEGTLFVHFKNKQTLVDSLYVAIKKKEATLLDEVIDDSESVEKTIRAIGQTIINYFTDNYEELLFLEHVKQLGLASKKAVEESNKHLEKMYNYMLALQKAKKIKSLNCEAIGSMIWSMMVAAVHYCNRENKRCSPKMLDPIWDAIRA